MTNTNNGNGKRELQTEFTDKEIRKETRNYRWRMAVGCFKITCIIVAAIYIILLFASDDVHAFFGWNSSTAQERYTEAEENYSRAQIAAETARIQLLERQGDLAFEKMEKAAQAKDTIEIDRLRKVIENIGQEVTQAALNFPTR